MKYLVKKDGRKTDKENWLVMDRKEYDEFTATRKGQRRKKNFEKLPGCCKENGDLYIECGESTARDWKAENNHRYYLQQTAAESMVRVFSYDALDNKEEEIWGEEMLADNSADVEEQAFANLRVQLLYKAISLLNGEELEVISRVFLDESPISECELARRKGISREAIRATKLRAFDKMREYMLQNAV